MLEVVEMKGRRVGRLRLIPDAAGQVSKSGTRDA
jgi:hypothetical protein